MGLVWGLVSLGVVCVGLGLTSLGFRQVWFRVDSFTVCVVLFQGLTSLGGFPWVWLGVWLL